MENKRYTSNKTYFKEKKSEEVNINSNEVKMIIHVTKICEIHSNQYLEGNLQLSLGKKN